MKKVLLFGTFDGVHDGHLALFRQARELGDEVMVVVARDVTVKKVKNRAANNTENLRLKDVQAQTDVTCAQLGVIDGDKYAVIDDYRPDVILLGYDQEVFTEKICDVLKKYDLNTQIVRGQAYYPEKFKSSIINKYLSF